MDIQFHLLLKNPPAGVDFGIQQGTGSKFEPIQVQRSDGRDITFHFTIAVKNDPGKIHAPRFSGAVVQGRPADQFVYIGVGEFAGQAGGWSRRIKVPLTGISWEMIGQLGDDASTLLTTSVPGTAKDGTPTSGTVKPFKGWHIIRAAR